MINIIQSYVHMNYFQNNANNFNIINLLNVNYSSIKMYIKIKQKSTLRYFSL